MAEEESDPVIARVQFGELVRQLLQTAEFAFAALSTSPVIVASDVLGLAAERAARGRKIVRPGGPGVWVVLGEDALHRSNGGPGILRAGSNTCAGSPGCPTSGSACCRGRPQTASSPR
ncbi:Scr1 family TA system antitoxin-like transcriptional regulator [Saccharothrix yanglingensis]|uniref:DUF5753 domain-containing protein n=1 Tax=Saccharothrix yanglingensis TaxID=659496 RepID=A0ABU0X0Y8_9PSEU|nr:Scr1 family TA system antitoxin-like transcriptional regulator [Saccharothrix yanglingensis]MDQ2585796.1 hypothetical protein [Saccharothrix yanglingensis]